LPIPQMPGEMWTMDWTRNEWSRRADSNRRPARRGVRAGVGGRGSGVGNCPIRLGNERVGAGGKGAGVGVGGVSDPCRAAGGPLIFSGASSLEGASGSSRGILRTNRSSDARVSQLEAPSPPDEPAGRKSDQGRAQLRWSRCIDPSKDWWAGPLMPLAAVGGERKPFQSQYLISSPAHRSLRSPVDSQPRSGRFCPPHPGWAHRLLLIVSGGTRRSTSMRRFLAAALAIGLPVWVLSAPALCKAICAADLSPSSAARASADTAAHCSAHGHSEEMPPAPVTSGQPVRDCCQDGAHSLLHRDQSQLKRTEASPGFNAAGGLVTAAPPHSPRDGSVQPVARHFGLPTSPFLQSNSPLLL
jgi:hypothetical protein